MSPTDEQPRNRDAMLAKAESFMGLEGCSVGQASLDDFIETIDTNTMDMEKKASHNTGTKSDKSSGFSCK